MSMRDKALRDRLRKLLISEKSFPFPDGMELLDLADERDELQNTLDQVLTDTADELGCASNNEEILRSIHTMKAELERYWNAVPEDVDINTLCETMFLAGREGEILDSHIVMRDNIKTLIGSLLERQRQKIEAAWIDGADDWRLKPRENSITALRSKAKAYAEKIMGGKDE